MSDRERARNLTSMAEPAAVLSESASSQVPTVAPTTGPVVAIIQARMGSSRLPGKSLAEIEKSSMLWHVIDRVKRAKLIDRVVVATSVSRSDDAIETFCRGLGVRCYRGSENDVLDRFCSAARAEKAAQVVRITADCPLIDPEIIDRSEERRVGKECSSRWARYH